jgi:ribosomal-protein-alanine N-acetyltransferase
MSNRWRAPETIETARLVLRRHTAADATAVFEHYGRDAEVARYMSWRQHVSVADADAFIARCLTVRDDASAFPWAIVRRDDGRLIGGFELRVEAPRAEFGYCLARTEWGKGYTPEAARAVVELALAHASIFRVWAFCDVEKVRSARVLEKAGLTREGCLRSWFTPPAFGVPHDVWCYARIKARP